MFGWHRSCGGLSGTDVFVPESPPLAGACRKSQRAHQMLMRIGNQRYADETIRDIEHTLSKDSQKVSGACWSEGTPYHHDWHCPGHVSAVVRD
jgi:hypothetical protein